LPSVMDHPPQDFEKWYQDLRPGLVASLFTVFGDADIAVESADEAIVRAFERWNKVAVMSSPGGWTYKVALNIGRRRCRRQRLERQLLARSYKPLEDVEEPATEIWQVVASLPTRQRTAVVLRHVSDLTEADIAAAMGISRGGVSATLRAAYSSIRNSTYKDRNNQTMEA
jgi:RNA polymerase sigma factor (sigma-70 family)